MLTAGFRRSMVVFLAILLFMCVCGISGCTENKAENKKEADHMGAETVRIDGKEMEYLHFGREGGEKFVILPGLSLKSVMGSAEMIVPAYALLAENYDIYLFDHIKDEPEGYDIKGMAEDTLAAFDRLGLDRVHLMGVSMGGMVAQTIAADEPDRVSSLILCSTAMNTAHSDQDLFAGWEELAGAKDTPALMASFGERVYTPSFYEAYKDIIIASGEGATDRDYANFMISLKAVKNFDISKETDKISCPAYVIGAGEDRVLGTQAAGDLAAALKCECFVYEGFGHGVYDEAPDYLSHIDAFLKES